jgi:TatD DNase family protein
MLIDAHCHPYDLTRIFPEAEQERRQLGVLIAASSYLVEEFTYKENIAHNVIDRAEMTASIFSCHGIHPQYPAAEIARGKALTNNDLNSHLDILSNLAKDGKLAAIGECGFDLYNDAYKETEAMQDAIFAAHLEIAHKYDLPLVLHVRRAMHKIFACVKILSNCKAVVFHTWPGSYEEAVSLLKHGVNAYFSFGNIIMLNHKKAMKSCALLPAERLLTETDAPYAPRRGEKYSSWKDLPLILETAARLRSEAGNNINAADLETQIEANFRSVFL